MSLDTSDNIYTKEENAKIKSLKHGTYGAAIAGFITGVVLTSLYFINMSAQVVEKVITL